MGGRPDRGAVAGPAGRAVAAAEAAGQARAAGAAPVRRHAGRARRLARGGGEIGRLARVLRHVGAERAQLESFNAQVMRRLSSVMAAAPVGICFTRDKRFELVSDEFCRLFGRTEAEMLGQPASTIYASNEDYQRLGGEVGRAFADHRPYLGEWPMLRADGTRFWGQLRGRPVADGDPSAGTIWTIADISEQVAAREQLEWSATHDALTGLANRKLFSQRLARVVEALPRSMPAVVVMIDLDHFKPINDRAGHAAGDAMLKAVAAAITSRVRATDWWCAWAATSSRCCWSAARETRRCASPRTSARRSARSRCRGRARP
ncbi:diguanylate cyclase [Piscinibacter aquaticus]|uniref:Diguanylate cyclase n=1 Tax=Piscinibacter aquaticus TaxID=392597 RepID=A0A5C6U473_9BURK|nr:diguanylate cyclase [Piscinibacter aquaticus]